MSLFRRERVFASVELDRVALVRLGADGTAREEAVIPLALDPGHPDKSLRVVREALAAPAWRGAARNVVLSDRLVRYVVVEQPEGVRSLAEMRLACEARFQASFDQPASEWELEMDPRPFARRFLVCGVQRRLLDAARTTFASEGTLESLRPFLVCELRRLARLLPANCWFVVVARDCVTLAGIAQNECRLVRVLATEQPSVPAVQEALGRETLLTGEITPDASILIAGVLQGDISATTMRRVDASSWGSRASSWASEYRLALSERWA